MHKDNSKNSYLLKTKVLIDGIGTKAFSGKRDRRAGKQA